MVATPFYRSISKAVAVAGAALLTIAAHPALAASAAAVEMTAPVKEAQGSVSSGDEQFRKLFADWKALDGQGKSQPVAQVQVSVPSRTPIADYRVSSAYGMREHPVLGGRRGHKGIDLAAPIGTPVYATADGTVSRADRFSSYGLFVSIEHGAHLQTRYAHMSKLAVADGERVHKGQLIGYVGTTGRSTGPHLHYEVRVDGQAVNPMPYMLGQGMDQALAMIDHDEAMNAMGGGDEDDGE